MESFKMLGYLAFPIAIFTYFNSPSFYEDSLRQTMENVSKDINFENLSRFEKLVAEKEIDKLNRTIDELDKANKQSSSKS